MNFHNDILSAITKAGIIPANASISLINDGRVHRFRIEGDNPGSLNGWIVMFPDGRGCAFGSWKTNIQSTFFVDAQKECAVNSEELLRIREKARLATALAEKARHREAATKSLEIWQGAKLAQANHPYLIQKQIKPNGCRQYKDSLIVPIWNNVDQLVSLQFISPSGEKRFKSGGEIKGCSFGMGDPANSHTILLCEGFATGATLYEASGYPVVICFSAGNLMAVASSLRKKYATHRLIICADNDYKTAGNPGLTKAREAATYCNASVIYPPEDLTVGSDFNDLAAENTIDIVAALIMEVAK